MLKARLYITPDLFVQVYRNERFDTTPLPHAHQPVDQLGVVREVRHDQVGPGID